MQEEPPTPPQRVRQQIRFVDKNGVEIEHISGVLSYEIEAAAEEAAERRQNSERAAAVDRLVASLAGTGAVAAGMISALGVAGAAAFGPLLAAAAGVVASFAVSVRLLDNVFAPLGSLVQQLLTGRAIPKQQPAVHQVRPSIEVLGERLAAQRIGLQDLSPRHREVTRA